MEPRRAARALCAFYAAFEAGAPAGIFAQSGPLRGIVVPGADSPFPSANPNRAWLHADDVPSAGDLAALDAAYRAAGVSRYFLALLPKAGSDAAAKPLLDAGFVDFRGPDYIALVRESAKATAPSSNFAIRLLPPDEVRARADELAALQGSPQAGARFLDLAGVDGFEHFAAFDGGDLVAAALSKRLDDAIYLGFGATLPSHRGRGAQSALIAARVSRARELGVAWCLSETLSFGDAGSPAEASLRNLLRGGFQPVLALRMMERRLA